ncbi:hypothetical protein HMPREF3039_01012 [Akkermansia sp. KLE1798]|nr:hypothetical protein HMPREF3039_01012 [Akkermansia sp. KLE1798]
MPREGFFIPQEGGACPVWVPEAPCRRGSACFLWFHSRSPSFHGRNISRLCGGIFFAEGGEGVFEFLIIPGGMCRWKPEGGV